MGEKIEPEEYPTLREVKQIIDEKLENISKQIAKQGPRPRKSQKTSNDSGVTIEKDEEGSTITKGSKFN